MYIRLIHTLNIEDEALLLYNMLIYVNLITVYFNVFSIKWIVYVYVTYCIDIQYIIKVLCKVYCSRHDITEKMLNWR
jgi:hypothetical protein